MRTDGRWTVEAFSGVGVQDVRAHETADGSKTVTGQVRVRRGADGLLYFHHDVQPATAEEGWESPPWELTERSAAGYGAARRLQGSLAAHLTALRALGNEPPVTVKIVGEGSEEQERGLEKFVRRTPTCSEPTRSSSVTRATSRWACRP